MGPRVSRTTTTLGQQGVDGEGHAATRESQDDREDHRQRVRMVDLAEPVDHPEEIEAQQRCRDRAGTGEEPDRRKEQRRAVDRDEEGHELGVRRGQPEHAEDLDGPLPERGRKLGESDERQRRQVHEQPTEHGDPHRRERGGIRRPE